MGRIFFALMLAVMALSACKGGGGQTSGSDDFRGFDVTARFVDEAAGTYRDEDTGQILLIGKHGTIQYLTVSPQSTLDCSFVISGTLTKMIQRNDADRGRGMLEATHVLEWEQQGIKADKRLEASSESNTYCTQHIRSEKASLPRTSLLYLRWSGKQLHLLQSDGLVVDEIFQPVTQSATPYERKIYACSVELFPRETTMDDAFDSRGLLASLPVCLKRRTPSSQETLLEFYNESEQSKLLVSYSLNATRGQEGLSVDLHRALYPEDGSPEQVSILDHYEAGVALAFRDIDKYKIKVACRYAKSCRQSALR
jgi:hypothetical protein